RRRVPDSTARPLSPQALSQLLDGKPHLLRPLVLQLLPPPLAPVDPAGRLGIDLSSLGTVEDFRRMLPIVLAGISIGKIAPGEGLASGGDYVPSCARSGASPGLSAGYRVRSIRPARCSRRIPRPV